MARIISLKYPATCAECGAHLPKGSEARYYGPRKIYGTTCHERSTRNSEYDAGPPRTRQYCDPEDEPREPLGLTLSRHDRYGFYSSDGVRLGSSCGCEDYPMLRPLEPFENAVKSVIPAGQTVTLGNVDFWVDSEGPWADQLSFSLPINAWDVPAISRDLTAKLGA